MEAFLCVNDGIKVLAEFSTAIVAFLALFKGICEYEDFLRRNRTQLLLDFSDKYTKDEQIKKVSVFLEKLEDDNMYGKEYMNENNTYKEEALDIHNIEMFMHFIEQIELLIQSHSISESAALNLFGHYTIILDKYNCRWPTLGYDEKYWNVYRSFVKRAKNFDYNNITV